MGGFDTLFFTKDNYTTFCKKLHQFAQILPRLKPISRLQPIYQSSYSFQIASEKFGTKCVVQNLGKVGCIATALHGWNG